MPIDQADESSDLRDAISGDVAALTALLTNSYDELRGRIARLIPANLRSQLDADDIVQEAHIAVFRHMGDFQPQGSISFDRWVQTIGLHKLRKAIRAKRSAKRGGNCLTLGPVDPLTESMSILLNAFESPGNTPSGSVARLEAIDKMQQAMAELPDDFRMAVQLVYIQGMPAAEAAAIMQRTERAVYNLCFKAKEHLRGLMASRSHYLSTTT